MQLYEKKENKQNLASAKEIYEKEVEIQFDPIMNFLDTLSENSFLEYLKKDFIDHLVKLLINSSKENNLSNLLCEVMHRISLFLEKIEIKFKEDFNNYKEKKISIQELENIKKIYQSMLENLFIALNLIKDKLDTDFFYMEKIKETIESVSFIIQNMKKYIDINFSGIKKSTIKNIDDFIDSDDESENELEVLNNMKVYHSNVFFNIPDVDFEEVIQKSRYDIELDQEKMFSEAIRLSLLPIEPESIASVVSIPFEVIAPKPISVPDILHQSSKREIKLKYGKTLVFYEEPKEGFVLSNSILGKKYFRPFKSFLLERLDNLLSFQESARALETCSKNIEHRCQNVFENIKMNLKDYYEILSESIDEWLLKKWYKEIHDLHWLMYRIDSLLKSKKIDFNISKKEKDNLKNLLKVYEEYTNIYLNNIRKNFFDKKLFDFYNESEIVLFPIGSENIVYRAGSRYIAKICRRYLNCVEDYEKITTHIGNGKIFEYHIDDLEEIKKVLIKLMTNIHMQSVMCTNEEVSMLFKLILGGSNKIVQEITGSIQICVSNLDKSSELADKKTEKITYSKAQLITNFSPLYQSQSSTKSPKKRKLEKIDLSIDVCQEEISSTQQPSIV